MEGRLLLLLLLLLSVPPEREGGNGSGVPAEGTGLGVRPDTSSDVLLAGFWGIPSSGPDLGHGGREVFGPGGMWTGGLH